MPKETKIESTITKFYKRNTLDLCLFGFVQGFLTAIPHATTKQAVCAFLKKYKLSEDEYGTDTACRTYARINENFIWKDS